MTVQSFITTKNASPIYGSKQKHQRPTHRCPYT